MKEFNAAFGSMRSRCTEADKCGTIEECSCFQDLMKVHMMGFAEADVRLKTVWRNSHIIMSAASGLAVINLALIVWNLLQ